MTETDATNVIPAVSTSIGGYVGAFTWGPVNEPIMIGSELELVQTFGTPNSATGQSFLTAASFLKYGNSLKVVRALGKSGSVTFKNATTGDSGNSGLLIQNHTDYENQYENGAAAVGAWGAKCPGTLGNSLKVSVCTANSTAFTAWAYKGEFNTVPSTSAFAAAAGSSLDEMHIVVVDEDGLWTGTPGSILERFDYVSQARDALKQDGTSNYYKTVLNGNSKYVYWLDHPDANNSSTAIATAGDSVYSAIAFTNLTAALNYSFIGGTDVAVAKAEIMAGLDLFADAETVDVNLLFAGPDANGENDIANYLVALAEGRKDLVVFLSPPIEDTVGTSSPATDVVTWANAITSSSYAVMDSTALKVYDKYNDVMRWIPANGHVAGLCANVDEVADAWWSPAGYNRGQLLSVTKLAFNPKKADRDSLYKARVNPIVSFPGAGTVLFGDKTALAKPSAFDQIGIRRLFIVMEKAIATASKFMLFEFNDEFTQASFRNQVEPFLRDIKGRRGIKAFQVICDDTNNTSEVVDNNRFVGSIYVAPAHSINNIQLNFVATRTGVEFSELVGKA